MLKVFLRSKRGLDQKKEALFLEEIDNKTLLFEILQALKVAKVKHYNSLTLNSNTELEYGQSE
jgi:hypothetical protein